MVYELLIDFDPLTNGQDIVSCGVFDTPEKAEKAKLMAEELIKEKKLSAPEWWDVTEPNPEIYIIEHKLNRFELWDNKRDI